MTVYQARALVANWEFRVQELCFLQRSHEVALGEVKTFQTLYGPRGTPVIYMVTECMCFF